MPFSVGPMEIVVLLIVALIVFGPKRLPELGSGLGRSIREFRGGLDSDKAEGAEQLPPADAEQASADAERASANQAR